MLPKKSSYPRVVFYRPDGNGRDQYIHYNNGGLFNGKALNFSPKRETVKSNSLSPFRDQRAFIPPKYVHYISDGSGRDKYVIKGEGGLSHEGNQTLSYFYDKLRDYDPRNNTVRANENSVRLPVIEGRKRAARLQTQKQLCQRLSSPKTPKSPRDKSEWATDLRSLKINFFSPPSTK